MSDGPLLTRAVRLEDPLEALRALAHLPFPFLLHSSLEDSRGRWSFFGADPFFAQRGGDPGAAIARFRALAAAERGRDRTAHDAPFTGGAVGYRAYDYGRRLERIPEIARDDLGLPDFAIGFYDVVGAFDHARRRAWIHSSGLPSAGAARAARAAARLDAFTALIEAAPAGGGTPAGEAMPAGGARPRGVRSTFTPDGYRRAVERVREHIRAGDIFQANLSQRWSVPFDAAVPVDVGVRLHAALARRSPAPFAAFFGAGDHAVVSASPERFLELRDRRVETRPIKGTRPRSGDPTRDALARAALCASAKDRAENVMIVDVLRNDLSRVCASGSVETPALCELEAFPQVFHLTSTVTGVLREGLDAPDLLDACFPGGSITGAPKIRAMQIIDALEPVRRHVYTGAIGYLDWSGDADFNIAIRTALVTPRALHFAAGGGITADSDPDAEFEETLHKAEGLRLAIEALLGPLALTPDAAARP